MAENIVMTGEMRIELGETRLIPGPKGDTGERGPRGYGLESATLNPDYTLTLSFENGETMTTGSIRGERGIGIEEITLTPGDHVTKMTDTLRVTLSDTTSRSFEIFNSAAQSALEAGESAASAEGSAREASRAEKAAGVSRDEAAASAAAAAGSEQRAQSLAEAAGTGAGRAEESAREAQAALSGAGDARDAAASAASDAQGSAMEAAASARSAAEYSGRPPRIGGSGTWEIWDSESGSYSDTGSPARGETGGTGPVGPKGDTGDVWVPSVSESGDLSWQISSGEAPGTVNIRGPKGEPGPQGPKGDGTGDMLAELYDPQGKREDVFAYVDGALMSVPAENVRFADGESFQEKLESGGLRGEKGDRGPAGEQGPAGAAGPAGPAGAAGRDGVSPTVTVSRSGTVTTVTITDATGERQAEINDGAAGPTGPQGPAGAEGPTGPAGPAGPSGPQGPAGPNSVGTSTATDITGLLKGDGTAVVQAAANADYLPAAGPAFTGTMSGEEINLTGNIDLAKTGALTNAKSVSFNGGNAGLDESGYVLRVWQRGVGNAKGILGNLAAPTADDHAANKAYVDSSIKSAIQATWEASY